MAGASLSNGANTGNAALNATGSSYAKQNHQPTTDLISRAMGGKKAKRRNKRKK